MPYPSGRIVGIRVFRNDIEVVREGTPLGHDPVPRKEIEEFSWESRRRLAFVASNTSVRFRTLVTLTYPAEFPSDGRKIKRDWHAFLIWLRRDTGGCSYLWFLEFQARGAPHIHAFIDYPLPRRSELRRGLRFRVSTQWYRTVGSGDPKHLSAGTRIEAMRKPDGARRYAVKEAIKMRQKVVPAGYRNVGRFWGCSRDVPPLPQLEVACTEDDIRAVLMGWKYAPGEETPLYRVLYNTADRFRQWMLPGGAPLTCNPEEDAQT